MTIKIKSHKLTKVYVRLPRGWHYADRVIQDIPGYLWIQKNDSKECALVRAPITKKV